jgi:eukaryotic-like serine/threonine-protein kinase
MPDDELNPRPAGAGPAAEQVPTRGELPGLRRTASGELRRGAALGRYLVLERLGAGGMGVVYSAYDPTLDRRVALKLLHGERLQRTSERDRFRREALALARLAHPNVVTVHDAGEAAGEMYLAAELVDGRTFGDWLQERPRDWREALALLLQAGRGLEAAHAAGLVHRDFKPSNVLVGNDGRVRVTDFGLAREVGGGRAEEPTPAAGGPPAASGEAGHSGPLSSTVTLAGSVLGTPAYMAPEQFRGEAAGPRTDQFAFCVAAWEALFGQRPFADGALAQRVTDGEAGRLVVPSQERSVPGSLRAALVRGMAPRRTDRFPSMAALLAALEQAQRPRRRRLVAAAAAVALLLAAAGAWMLRPAPLLPSGGRVLVLPFADGTPEGAATGRHLLVAAALDGLPTVEALGPASGLAVEAVGPEADAGILGRLREAHGADLVVAARLVAEHARYTLDYRVVGAGAGARLRSLQAGEPVAAANELAARLGHLLVPGAPAPDLRHAFSEDPFVNRLYAAGLAAMSRGGPSAGRHYFAAAIDQDPSFHRARLKLAEALHLQSDPEGGATLLGEVVAAAREQGDRPLLAAALSLAGDLELERGLVGAARPQLVQALDLYRGLEDRDGQLDALLRLAHLAQRAGEPTTAAMRLDEASEIATVTGMEYERARIENLRGLAAMDAGDTAAAQVHFERAAGLLRRLGARQALATVLGNLGLIAADEGRFAGARALLAEELVLQEDLGNEREVVTNILNQAWVGWRSGACDGIAPRVERALRLVEQQDNPFLATHLRLNAYLCATVAGEARGHEPSLRRAVRDAERTGDPSLVASARLALGEALLREGRAAEAREQLAAVASAIPPEDDSETAALVPLLAGRLALQAGRCDEARDELARARRAGALWRAEDERLLRQAVECGE